MLHAKESVLFENKDSSHEGRNKKKVNTNFQITDGAEK